MKPANHETAVQALNAIPATAAVVATKFLGLDISTWLGLFGIAFIALQASYLLWKWRRDYLREKRGLPPSESQRGAL